MTNTSLTGPMRMRAVGMMAVLCLAAGCSSTAPARPAAATPSRPTAAASALSPSPSSPAQQALAVYRAMWADVQQVSASVEEPSGTGLAASDSPTPNYQNPILAQHLAGAPLLTIQENLDVDESQGIIALGAPVLHPTVVSATAGTVHLTDCIDGTHWLQYYASTRALVNNVPGGFRYTTATVTNQNGTWMVTQLDSESDGTCHIPE